MLYFVHANRKETSHNIGNGYRHPNPETVVEVQADCDELEAIRIQFKNLPLADIPIVRWFGDHARFIAANLKL